MNDTFKKYSIKWLKREFWVPENRRPKSEIRRQMTVKRRQRVEAG
jgi:hypothetical protein